MEVLNDSSIDGRSLSACIECDVGLSARSTSLIGGLCTSIYCKHLRICIRELSSYYKINNALNFDCADGNCISRNCHRCV